MPPLAQPAAPTTTGEATLLKFRWDSGATSTRILAKPTFVKAPNHGAAGDVQKVPLGSPVLSQEELREYSQQCKNSVGTIRIPPRGF